MIYGSSGVVTPGVREASLPTAEGHHGHLVGLDGCQWHIAATGERGTVGTGWGDDIDGGLSRLDIGKGHHAHALGWDGVAVLGA